MKIQKAAIVPVIGLALCALTVPAWGQGVPSPDNDFEVAPPQIMATLEPSSQISRTLVIRETAGQLLGWEIVEALQTCPVAGFGEDVPWLSADPITGTLQASGRVTVTITLDSTGLDRGLHRAILCIRNSNVVTDTVPVAVAMQIGQLPVPALSSLGLGAFALLLVASAILLIHRRL